MSEQYQDEQELIRACLQGERKSQELLYYRYADAMYSIALIYAKSGDDASDILQDAFIKVFRNLSKYRFDGPLGAWVRRIVVRTSIDFFRKRRLWQERHNTSVELEQLNTSSVEETLSSLSYQEIIEFVNQLPNKAQLVLKLYSIEGYSHKEIAELMDISEGTSKSQLNRARKLLQASMQTYYGQEEPK